MSTPPDVPSKCPAPTGSGIPPVHRAGNAAPLPDLPRLTHLLAEDRREGEAVTAPHILVVTADPDPEFEHDYAVECPGVTPECQRWEPCDRYDCPVPSDTDEAYDRPVAHDEVHRYIGDRWMTPTGSCYLVWHDGLPDAVAGRFKPGRHPICWDVGDGTELWIFALDPADT